MSYRCNNYMHVLMTLVMLYEQTYSNNILSDLCSLDICSFFTAWRIESRDKNSLHYHTLYVMLPIILLTCRFLGTWLASQIPSAVYCRTQQWLKLNRSLLNCVAQTNTNLLELELNDFETPVSRTVYLNSVANS